MLQESARASRRMAILLFVVETFRVSTKMNVHALRHSPFFSPGLSSVLLLSTHVHTHTCLPHLLPYLFLSVIYGSAPCPLAATKHALARLMSHTIHIGET